ncbi:MAG: YceD family protein [Ilumatobacteraceae bacterium]
MPDPLVVNAAELLRRPGTDKVLDLVVPLDSLEVRDDDRFAVATDVSVHLRLESLSDGIVVDGALDVPWQGTCRRCLAPTGGVTHSEVHELYQRVVTDPDAFEIVGEQLDLRPVVRELVLLDAPATPLCRPDCAGLCPSCGINRNEGGCDCTPAPADDRWSALDQLRDLPRGD